VRCDAGFLVISCFGEVGSHIIQGIGMMMTTALARGMCKGESYVTCTLSRRKKRPIFVPRENAKICFTNLFFWGVFYTTMIQLNMQNYLHETHNM
jgi:hypothetical protein